MQAYPKYGSEKKGLPTTYYLTIAETHINMHSELEKVELLCVNDPTAMLSPLTLKGLVEGGAIFMQSPYTDPADVWSRIPEENRRTIREKKLRVFYCDMVRIAREVEAGIAFKTYAAIDPSDAHALSEGASAVARSLNVRAIVVLTTTGYTARLVAAERSKTALFALTTDANVYHALNLHWCIKPLLVTVNAENFEGLVALAEDTLRDRGLVAPGDRILVVGGPPGQARGSNFLKLHLVG